jgi:hypothetical protein
MNEFTKILYYFIIRDQMNELSLLSKNRMNLS